MSFMVAWGGVECCFVWGAAEFRGSVERLERGRREIEECKRY